MNPETLKKQKEAENMVKMHDANKTNHYAKLGKTFNTGALAGGGGRGGGGRGGSRQTSGRGAGLMR
jgi:hypothetical protein